MIAFENIKTGEKIVFTAEQDPVARQAHMAAYLNSSNLSPNALKGQDFGWRLAPEVVADMDKVRGSLDLMDNLARRIGVNMDDVKDFHILNYVAEQKFAGAAMAAKQANSPVFEEEYNRRLKELREKSNPVNSVSETDSAKIEEPKATNKKEK